LTSESYRIIKVLNNNVLLATKVDSCITRLRLTLKDNSIVKDEAMTSLGANGVLRPNSRNMQVIVGTKAELIAEEMKRLIK